MLGCALLTKFFGHNSSLIDLDELITNISSFLKLDNAFLVRRGFLCFVTSCHVSCHVTRLLVLCALVASARAIVILCAFADLWSDGKVIAGIA